MRFLKILSVGLATLSIAISSSHAAEIFNQTDHQIGIKGVVGPPLLDIPARRKSESFDWMTVTEVLVADDKGHMICNLDFGDDPKMQGANYMVVSGSGYKGGTNCGVCDAGHHVIAGSVRC
jgi:hypothetical protein